MPYDTCGAFGKPLEGLQAGVVGPSKVLPALQQLWSFVQTASLLSRTCY